MRNNNSQGIYNEQVEFMWVVQPGFEKEIITLSISKNMTPGDYKGYFHVKTDHDNIVLQVEFQIVEGGAYSAVDMIDFGLLTSVAEKKTMELRLLNSRATNLLVLEVVTVDVDPQLQIFLYDNPIIYSGSTPSVIGKLEYTASNPGKVLNKLLVLTNNSNAATAAVEVPYTATILHGGVGFEHQKAVFVVPVRNVSYLSMIRQLSKVKYRISQCDECLPFEDPKNNHITPRFRSVSQCKYETAQARSQQEAQLTEREFLLTNYFSVPVTLQAISISACTEVITTESSILANNSADSLNKWGPISLQFNQSKALSLLDKDRSFLPKTCWLEILTNVSSHRVPLHIIDGSLSISFMDAVKSILLFYINFILLLISYSRWWRMCLIFVNIKILNCLAVSQLFRLMRVLSHKQTLLQAATAITITNP